MAQGYFEMQTGAAFQLADYLLYLLSHIHPKPPLNNVLDPQNMERQLVFEHIALCI